LTPDGLKKADEVPFDAPKDVRSGRTLNRITLLALIVALAWIAWDATRDQPEVSTPDVSLVTNKSVAVLPFADFSPNADQSWFADGLTDGVMGSESSARVSFDSGT